MSGQGWAAHSFEEECQWKSIETPMHTKRDLGKPLRFALLGPHGSSKSSLVSILSNNMTLENYYPTLYNSPILVEFQPPNKRAGVLLDPVSTLNDLSKVGVTNDKKSSIMLPEYMLRKLERKQIDKLKRKDIMAHPNGHPGPTTVSPKEREPIVVELIDTPGVEADDLIPFLEKSLDCRLSKDVLNNLANGYNTNYRSRVKPLIIGSGISDMNGYMDGYILTYSCVPQDPLPPAYEASQSTPTRKTATQLDIVRAVHDSIEDAWKEWTVYNEGWKTGGETEVKHSFSSRFKREADATVPGVVAMMSSSGMPPIVLVCTHIDSPLASPRLIEEGRELARKWNAAFVECSCSPIKREWENVYETIAVAIRLAEEKYPRASK